MDLSKLGKKEEPKLDPRGLELKTIGDNLATSLFAEGLTYIEAKKVIDYLAVLFNNKIQDLLNNKL